MKSMETALDVPPLYPLSELTRLSPALTYINILAAKLCEDGELSFEESALPHIAEKHGSVPRLTVSCTSPEAAHRIFSDREAAESFPDKLLEYLAGKNFRGVNFCFLRLFPFERESFTAFLRLCAEALHERGYTVGSIVSPPCALSLAAANDYEAQGEFLDKVNFLLSDCLYRSDSLERRLSDEQLSETLALARDTVPPGKLAVTLADHGLITAGGKVQVVPCALARTLHRDGAEYDDEKSYAALFEKLVSCGGTEISVRPAGRADKLIFEVLAKKFDIIK